MRFTILTRTQWSEPPRARHQVANSLANFYPVSFIEANYSGFPRIIKNDIANNLILYSSNFFLPNKIRFRLPFFNEFYQSWIFKKLKKNKNVNINDQLIIFDHTCHFFAEKWPGKKIYFCNDDHLRSYGIPLLKKYFCFTEKKILRLANCIIVTSGFLRDKFQEYQNKTYLLRLGSPTIDRDISLHYNNEEIIKVAWVGFGGTKNDFNVGKRLLNHEKGIELHFFGKINDNIISRFRKRTNFYYHGIKTGNKLYELLKKCNVGIAPYSLQDVNSGRTPNKLWLYLALGLPVVVTNLQNIRDWKFPDKAVYRSEDNNDFVDLIIKAHQENNSQAFNDRIDFAKSNTWDKRIEEMLKIIDKV